VKLVVGLGNPGTRYEGTRHNVGFMVADSLMQRCDRPTSYQARFDGSFARAGLDDQALALLKPQTFMNRSGRSVSQAMDFYKLGIEDLFVMHDDLDLAFGVVRVKTGGGSGGHRGLESCFAELGSREFSRIRIGIGRPAPGGDPTDYVLGKFDDEQQAELPDVVQLATEAAQEAVRAGAVAAMNRYNRRTADGGGEA